MPGLNVREALAGLREVRPGIEVVMPSCLSGPRAVAKAIRLGAHDYLPSPFRERAWSRSSRGSPDTAVRRRNRRTMPGPLGKAFKISRLRVTGGKGRGFMLISRAGGISAPVIIADNEAGSKILSQALRLPDLARGRRQLAKVRRPTIRVPWLEAEPYGWERSTFVGAKRGPIRAGRAAQPGQTISGRQG